MAQDPNAWWSKEFGDEVQRDFVQQFARAKEGWKRTNPKLRIFLIAYFLVIVVGECFLFRWLERSAH
jgi:hypothetical protein